jgi:hypothetical protein
MHQCSSAFARFATMVFVTVAAAFVTRVALLALVA